MALRLGQVYERDFTTKNFIRVRIGGVTYYRHKFSDNVFSADGIFVGGWNEKTNAVDFGTWDVAGPGGTNYTVSATGQVVDTQGRVVQNASFDIATGELSLVGQETMDLYKGIGALTEGETYERNLAGSGFFTVAHEAGTLYVNRKSGNTFTESGQYVGGWNSGTNSIDFFAGFEPMTPVEEPEEPGEPPLTPEQKGDLAYLQKWLADNELPPTLLGFIEESIKLGKTQDEVLLDLFQRPDFLAAYPEIQAREQNGLSRLSLAEIRATRDEMKNVAFQLFGIQATNADLSTLIGKGTSPRQWESRLLAYRRSLEMGGFVSSTFQQELGINLSDQELIEFFDPDITTSELDTAWQHAIFKSYLRNLGGAHEATEDQIAALKATGVSVEQAMQNYQQMFQVLPTLDRLAAIDSAVGADDGNPFDSFGQAFNQFQLLNPEAQSEVARLLARETARFTQEGGLITSGTQTVGGLDRFERARLRR